MSSRTNNKTLITSEGFLFAIIYIQGHNDHPTARGSTQRAPRGTCIARQRADTAAINDSEVMAARLVALQHLSIVITSAITVADDDADSVSIRGGVGGGGKNPLFDA